MKDLEILDFDTNETGMVITHESREYLRESAKWGKFLAIVGFVFVGIIALLALFAGSMLGGAMGREMGFAGGGIFITILYLGLAAVYFFPCLYLFNFSNKAKLALLTNSNAGMTEALKNLKSMFKFMGIFTIVILSLYAFIFVGSFLFIGASSF